ncbi:hypothetical protein H1Z61_12405 [Bacillus aquiflavi]|uniref:Group-specific protein n=1 Tax=Bacillus aquiflavi TaxID=2672567 RepID=A0A6B3W2N9_9BACI|nr:hypothetical protein [Bacillus aquiflavi]MBA4537910.1 hypothetical protein [Bacillus aquiflavi]NEY82166.1 hypothetical protein [Bacillus aquiflavi]UAC49245.1 hypothetical protein K6959_05060 [Bacillus aquiflavi]
MKEYLTIVLQFIIWSAYTLIEWLSAYDRIEYKIIMFVIFFYLAFVIGKSIVKSTKKTMILTALSLGGHFVLFIMLNSLQINF